MKKLLFYLVSLTWLFISCEKKPEDNSCFESFALISVISNKDTISLSKNEYATVTAKVSGCNLTLQWNASIGAILNPYDLQVIYSPSPCSKGEVTVTAYLKDEQGHSEQKSIQIIVTE